MGRWSKIQMEYISSGTLNSAPVRGTSTSKNTMCQSPGCP